jgi:hypothetical protein
MLHGRPMPRITKAYLVKLFEQQDGHCALTGVPLRMGGPHGVTIDRINPARGYTHRNIQLVTKQANAAKSNMTMAEFRRVCRKVLRHCGKSRGGVVARSNRQFGVGRDVLDKNRTQVGSGYVMSGFSPE